MKVVEKQIIDLLKSIVNSSSVKFNHLEEIDWRKIREISMKHNIEGLVYSSIKYNCIDGLDDKLIDKWKKATFGTGISINQFIKFTCRMFCLFQEKNIDFIVLKGIYLRYLYPNQI